MTFNIKKVTFKPFLYLSLLAISFSTIYPNLYVSAINGKYDERYYNQQYVQYYNPEDTGCGGTIANTANISQLSGSSNKEKVYNYWINQGLTPVQSAGITANIQAESNFSPFIQSASAKWPNGSYGLAQFDGTQRTAIVKYLKDKLDDVFTKYYSDTYSGPVTEKAGYVPDGVPQDVNDKFLLAELDYLSEYASTFAPSKIAVRVDGLKTDYGITIASDVKLLDFIKTLTSAGDTAKAWIYLYEQPSNIKSSASERATIADQILALYSTSGSSGTGNCVIGVGGLNFDQAKSLMSYYYKNRSQYFDDKWNASGQSNQCTAFSYYFNIRFIIAGAGSGDGKDVANNLVSNFPNFYKSTTKDNIQPFSIFSFTNDTHGHTGVILGIGSDGSIVVGEANNPTAFSKSLGLIEEEATGDYSDKVGGIVRAEHWKDIDSLIKAMGTLGLTDPTFASPVNPSDVISKVQASL